MKTIPLHIKTGISLAFSVVLWASAFVGIRIGLTGYSPGSLALLRYLIASVGMIFLYVFFSKRGKPELKDIPLIFFMGAAGFGVYNITLNYGEMTVPAGITSFILSQMPVIVMLLAPILLKEKITKGVWLGVLISVIGVGLIALGHHDTSSQTIQGRSNQLDLGIIYLLIAVFCGSIYAISYKILAHKYSPIELTSYAIWSGTFILLIYTPALCREINTAPYVATLASVYLGIFPAVIGYLAWSYVLSHMPASRASNYLFLMPLVATVLGWLFLGEVPKFLAFCGGIIALAGALMATQYDKYIKKVKTQHKKHLSSSQCRINHEQNQ